MPFTIPANATASVPLLFKGENDAAACGDPSTGSVSVSDDNVASAVITADGQWVTITPRGTGQATVAYSSANASAELDFEVAPVTVTSVTFDVDSAVFAIVNDPPPAIEAQSTVHDNTEGSKPPERMATEAGIDPANPPGGAPSSLT